MYKYWLVVWNMNFIFPFILGCDNYPLIDELHHFSEGWPNHHVQLASTSWASGRWFQVHRHIGPQEDGPSPPSFEVDLAVPEHLVESMASVAGVLTLAVVGEGVRTLKPGRLVGDCWD